MSLFNPEELKQLYTPSPESHKGQNGKVLVVGGSELFHAASLWALEIASKIVDMTFYSSVPTNEQIVVEQKKRFGNGIVVTGEHVEDYAEEADAILIGPGMVRSEEKIQDSRFKIQEIKDVLSLENEGEQTYFLTKYLLEKFPDKRWVIDAGALQMMDPQWLLQLTTTSILTPHQQEFERLFGKGEGERVKGKDDEIVGEMAAKYHCVILLKDHQDVVCSPEECVKVAGGNAGMTKGGTGDVLAGLAAALYAQNADAYLVAQAASYINKKAGDALFEKVGYYFNATDLLNEIPSVMKQILL